MPRQHAYFTIVAVDSVQVIEIRLAADVDTAAFNEIQRDLIDAWPFEAGQRLLVDLAASDYIGSVLLGLLVNLRQRARANRGEVALTGVSHRLSQTLRTSHLDRIFPIFATRQQAMDVM
jgi:anti-sigma B factor antagonist